MKGEITKLAAITTGSSRLARALSAGMDSISTAPTSNKTALTIKEMPVRLSMLHIVRSILRNVRQRRGLRLASSRNLEPPTVNKSRPLGVEPAQTGSSTWAEPGSARLTMLLNIASLGTQL